MSHDDGFGPIPDGYRESERPPPGELGKAKPNGHDTQASVLPQYVPLGQLKLSPDVFWLIDDTLPRGTSVMVYGRGGSGKTYLGTSIAIGITSGQWYGRMAEKGAVLYCAFERPDDAEDRLAALRDRLQLGELPIGLLRLPGFQLDDTIADHLITQAKTLAKVFGLPVRGVIIDTVSAALAGGREDDEGLGQLRAIGERIAAETGATDVLRNRHFSLNSGMDVRFVRHLLGLFVPTSLLSDANLL